MADLPTIPLQFPNIGNALASGAQARYAGTHADLLQSQMEGEQKARPDIPAALAGDPAALGRIAQNAPTLIQHIAPALARMDANQRAKVKEQTEFSATAANAVLQAAPSERAQVYDYFLKLGQSRGYNMGGLPPAYTPQIDPFLRSTRMAAVPITEWFKTQEGMPQPMVPPGTGAIAGGGANGAAIAGVESAGQPNNGYSAVGPVANPQGDRAYGRYQVMGSNVGPWTQEILGKAMTPQEFLANPEAQDKVFEAKFGQYVTKYGSPQAASRAWFAGEGGMNNPNATDVNGTTVAGYQQKFNAGLAPGTQVAGPPMAQGAPAANGPPVQLGGAPPAAPAAAPPAQAPAAPAQPAIDPNSPAARGGVPMGIKGVPVIKDGLQLFHMPDGQMEWHPVKGGPADPTRKELALEGDPTKEGQDYLASLPPQRQAQFQAWLQGRDKPSQRMMTTPQGKQLLDEFYKAYPNEYDVVLNGQRADTVKDFANGKSSVTVANLNQAISHGVGLVNAFANLKNNGGIGGPVLNYIGNQAAHLGDAGPQGAFEINRKAFVDELAGVFKMTGATDSEIRAWDQTLSMNDTPATFNAKMGKALELLQGRLDSLANKYETGTKTTLRQAGDLLSPQAKQQLQYIESKIGGGSPEPSMSGSAPAAAPAGGGEQQRLSPEDAAKLPPGTRFVGMDGVERVRH